MTDDAFVVPVAEAPPVRGKRTRVREGLRHPANWLQLIRFGAVGASGYIVNLAVFTAAVHGAGFGYLVAATMAFVVALANNFFWNRAWTFKARDGHAGFQAARFVLVEVVAVAEVPAQAIAIVAATPLNFLGNKLWSFRT